MQYESPSETYSSKIQHATVPSNNSIGADANNAIQIHGQYILAQVKSGLLLIDQKSSL